MFCITKWCKTITDSGKDEWTGREKKLKEHCKEKYGEIPTLYKFRLLDDDGEIYAYGLTTVQDSFAPLDKYMYDYGVTMIEYQNPKTKEYELL